MFWVMDNLDYECSKNHLDASIVDICCPQKCNNNTQLMRVLVQLQSIQHGTFQRRTIFINHMRIFKHNAHANVAYAVTMFFYMSFVCSFLFSFVFFIFFVRILLSLVFSFLFSCAHSFLFSFHFSSRAYSYRTSNRVYVQ